LVGGSFGAQSTASPQREVSGNDLKFAFSDWRASFANKRAKHAIMTTMIINRINGNSVVSAGQASSTAPTLHPSRSSLQCTVSDWQIADEVGESPRSPMVLVHSLLPVAKASIACGGGTPPQSKSTVNFCRTVCTANLGPCHPWRRHWDILYHADPACPSRKCLVRRIEGLATIVRGVASLTRRSVKQAASFNRPFFKKLYRIHDTADLSENEAIVSYENRLLEHAIFHGDLPSKHLTLRGEHELGRVPRQIGRKREQIVPCCSSSTRLDIRQAALDIGRDWKRLFSIQGVLASG
jgi:hypothetical protein